MTFSAARAEELAKMLREWRIPLSEGSLEEVASMLESARAAVTQWRTSFDAVLAEVERLRGRLVVIDRPAAQHVCVACGATMQTWQEFPEYQHEGCGGLVRLRAVVECDGLRAENERMRPVFEAAKAWRNSARVRVQGFAECEPEYALVAAVDAARAEGVKCSACGGDGYYKGPRLGDEPCPVCKGKGVTSFAAGDGQ